jgi:tetratricopeptide (TPR) repeat protein
MLGFALTRFAEWEVMDEGLKYDLEAMELILSLEKRSDHDIIFGVWPEGCVRGWGIFLEQVDPSERNKEMERMHEMINLTRRTINSELERVADNSEYGVVLHVFSQFHYTAEIEAITWLSYGFGFNLLSEEDAERWFAIFGKRIEEIEIVFKLKGLDLSQLRNTKGSLLKGKCYLYERQGKLELALEILREAVEEEDQGIILSDFHAQVSLKMGRIEEAFKSWEKFFSLLRSMDGKTMAAEHFERDRLLVPKESRPLFMKLLPHYPHILWAASSAGLAKLSKDENKALRSHLEVKKGLLCVNCSKELTKVYRCSQCNIATYCGSACQKEAWKEHKKICKKRE